MKIVLPLLLCSISCFTALEADKSEYKLGPVNNFEEIKIPVKLTNTSSSVIKLSAFRLSCGCAVTDFKKDTTISPNSKHTINVNFKPEKMSGWVRKPIFVKYIDDKRSKTLQLSIQAKVLTPITISPKVIDFNKSSQPHILTITNKSNLKITDIKFTYDQNYCQIPSLEEDLTISPKSKLNIELKPSLKSAKQKRKFSKVELSAKVGDNTINFTTVIKAKK